MVRANVVFSLALILLGASAALARAVPPAAVASPSPADQALVERRIRACESAWAAVTVTRDTTPMRDCLADDYQGVSSRSRVVDKAHNLLDPGPSPFVFDTVDYVHLRRPADNVIIAQGGETAVRKSGARSSLIWTDVWLLRNGRWQIVASQDTPLKTPYRGK